MRCKAPIPDETLFDYWARDLLDGGEMDQVEEHLFACSDCSARLDGLAMLGTGLTTLVRQGRVSGIVSRPLLNRIQRDGVHVRLYSLVPGETVPCAVFPGDELVVVALRGDFSGIETARLMVTGPGDSPIGEFNDVPISGSDGEVFCAWPAAFVREMPSIRLRFTLEATGAMRDELGTYVLEHSQ